MSRSLRSLRAHLIDHLCRKISWRCLAPCASYLDGGSALVLQCDGWQPARGGLLHALGSCHSCGLRAHRHSGVAAGGGGGAEGGSAQGGRRGGAPASAGFVMDGGAIGMHHGAQREPWELLHGERPASPTQVACQPQRAPPDYLQDVPCHAGPRRGHKGARQSLGGHLARCCHANS